MPRVRNINTMTELSAALTAAFNAINEHYYNNELEKVIITFKEGARKSAYGWIETRKQWVQGKNERYEINISVDYIGIRSIESTIATLMHEMAHLYNLMHEIKDTTRGGVYHNKKFKETAEAHGLKIDFHEGIGWSITSLPPATAEWIKENINIKGINIYKRIAEKETKGGKSKKQSMKKLVCPLCGNIVRVTKDISVMCGECTTDNNFVYFTEEKES